MIRVSLVIILNIGVQLCYGPSQTRQYTPLGIFTGHLATTQVQFLHTIMKHFVEEANIISSPHPTWITLRILDFIMCDVMEYKHQVINITRKVIMEIFSHWTFHTHVFSDITTKSQHLSKLCIWCHRPIWRYWNGFHVICLICPAAMSGLSSLVDTPDSKVYGPHVGPMNLAFRDKMPPFKDLANVTNQNIKVPFLLMEIRGITSCYVDIIFTVNYSLHLFAFRMILFTLKWFQVMIFTKREKHLHCTQRIGCMVLVCRMLRFGTNSSTCVLLCFSIGTAAILHMCQCQ